jgi:superoxide dismutase, Cu-Zn family
MRHLLGIVIIPSLIGCTDDGGGGNQTPGSRTLVATIAALPAGGAMTGTANVEWTEGDGMFVASAAISGDTPGASRPWHVHFGTCATGGDIVGSGGGYAPLVVGQDGTAQTTATIEFELSATAPYHVNVHESQAAITTLVACGDLAVAGSGGGSGGGGGGGGGDDDGY